MDAWDKDNLNSRGASSSYQRNSLLMQIDNSSNGSVLCYLEILFIKICFMVLQIPYNQPLLAESSCGALALTANCGEQSMQ